MQVRVTNVQIYIWTNNSESWTRTDLVWLNKINLTNKIVNNMHMHVFFSSCSSDAYLDCLFLLGSSAANMWTVPWSLDTQMSEASWLKLMLPTKRYFFQKLLQQWQKTSHAFIEKDAENRSQPVNVCSLWASSKLLNQMTSRGVKYSDKSPLFGRNNIQKIRHA